MIKLNLESNIDLNQQKSLNKFILSAVSRIKYSSAQNLKNSMYNKLHKELEKTGENIVKDARENIARKKRIATSKLYDSVLYKIKESDRVKGNNISMKMEVESNTIRYSGFGGRVFNYSNTIEHGYEELSTPSVNNILEWMHRRSDIKFYVRSGKRVVEALSGKQMRKAAFTISKSIGKNGFATIDSDGDKFLTNAVNKNINETFYSKIANIYEKISLRQLENGVADYD